MRSIGSRERIGTELMSNTEKRVTNVLLTCASDAEIGGVQTSVPRPDLLARKERTGTCIWSIRHGCQASVQWRRSTLGDVVRSTSRCLRWSGIALLASVPIFLGYTPIHFFNLACLIRKKDRRHQLPFPRAVFHSPRDRRAVAACAAGHLGARLRHRLVRESGLGAQTPVSTYRPQCGPHRRMLGSARKTDVQRLPRNEREDHVGLLRVGRFPAH